MCGAQKVAPPFSEEWSIVDRLAALENDPSRTVPKSHIPPPLKALRTFGSMFS
jgi:hypothetical protein